MKPLERLAMAIMASLLTLTACVLVLHLCGLGLPFSNTVVNSLGIIIVAVAVTIGDITLALHIDALTPAMTRPEYLRMRDDINRALDRTADVSPTVPPDPPQTPSV